MLKEFKEFISQGNVIDLAVGVVIGAAFTAIVNSIVAGIIMPIVGIFVGKSFETIVWTINGSPFAIGSVIQAVIEFFIISFVLFTDVKTMNKFKKPVEVVEAAPVVSEEVQLLREIRDSLNK